MPRKPSKRTKRQSSKSKTISTQRIEKDLLSIPSKLVAKFNKDIKQLRNKEHKLKSSLNKSLARGKNLESRVNTASKKTNTTTGRKVLAKVKKTHGQTLKVQDFLNKELENTKQLLENLLQKQAKWTALDKHIGQFEKEWATSSKKVKPAVSKKSKKTERKVKIEAAEKQAPQTEPADKTSSEPAFYDTTEEVIS